VQTKTRKPRRLRREALVFAHLERVSKDLLVEHPDIVRKLIGRNAGVYALYRKNKLYYVGLPATIAQDVSKLVDDVYRDLSLEANKRYPQAYLAQLFTNQQKLTAVSKAMSAKP
jgi:hypothetical protein